jgi:hypothetical protein
MNLPLLTPYLTPLSSAFNGVQPPVFSLSLPATPVLYRLSGPGPLLDAQYTWGPTILILHGESDSGSLF